MEPIYHSYLHVPILSLINGIILLVGFYYLGEFIQKKFKLNKIIDEVSMPNYQNILISVNFILLFLYPICLFFSKSNYLIHAVTFIIFLYGIIQIIKKLKFIKIKKKIISLKINFQKIDYILIFFILSGLTLLSFAPVTNADSLDYHLFSAKFLLENGSFPTDITNFHSSRLSGAGEILISMGLAVGSEQFGSIIQLSGLLTVIGIFKKYKVDPIYYLAFLSSPVLIFFISSLKPQLFSICTIAFVFTFIIQNRFDKKIFSEYDIKKILFLFCLLFLSTQIKFSFFLSTLLLLGTFILLNFKFKKLIQTAKLLIPLYFVIIFLPIIWKYNTFGGNFFELLYSPFETSLYGLYFFKKYLTGLTEANILWFVLPTSLSNLTHSLGIGTLIIFYAFFVQTKKKYYLFTLIILFILISYFFGQFTSRFFVEPFLWILIFLCLFKRKIKFNKYYIQLIRFQSVIIILAIYYGVINLTPGVINENLRERVLERNAVGYKFYQWVNKQLVKKSEPVITFNRSISLSNNYPISMEHLYFVNMNNKNAKDYVEEIKSINPKYLIFSERGSIYKKYINCTVKLIKKEKNIDFNAVRNPISKSNKKYDIYIYEISTKRMPDCINPNKVDPYARQ